MSRTTASKRRFRDRNREPGSEYADYLVRDPKGHKIGRVKDFYTNRRGEPEYVMVRMGLFGLRLVLIPVGFVALNEERRTLTLQ